MTNFIENIFEGAKQMQPLIVDGVKISPVTVDELESKLNKLQEQVMDLSKLIEMQTEINVGVIQMLDELNKDIHENAFVVALRAAIIKKENYKK